MYGVNILIDSTVRELRSGLAEMCGINRYISSSHYPSIAIFDFPQVPSGPNRFKS